MISAMLRSVWDHHAHAISASASVASGVVAIASHDAWLIEWFGVPLPVLLAGFAGAACSLSFLPSMGCGKAVTTLAASMAFAAYLVPIAVWYGNIPDKLALGLAFALALCAQTLVGAVLTLTPYSLKSLVDALIARIRGKAGP